MRIKNSRLFAYPVLTSMHDDYLNSFFMTKIKAVKKVKTLQLTIDCSLHNSEIEELLKTDKAEIVVHFECSKTKLRFIRKLKLGENEVEINSKMVNNDLEIITFIITKEDINNFTSENFNSDYRNMTFTIEKGQILAIANQVVVPIQKDIYDLSDVPSIITISPSEDKYMKVNMDNDKIIIYLPRKDFDTYAPFGKGINNYTPIFHAMIIIPALTYVFDKLEKCNGDFEEFSRNRWFSVIKKKIESLDYKFSSDDLARIGSLQLAQEILENPLSSALKNIQEIGDN